MTIIKCSEFVKRQTPESGYSHFEGTWEELEILTSNYFNASSGLCQGKSPWVKPGYKDGVVLVDLPGWKFKCAIVKLNEETKLQASYAPRRKGEDPYIRVGASAEKQIANHADVVLYRADVLAEDDDRSTNADWEIIAIKARMTKEEEPMDPYTMARNFLHMKGGTKGDFTAEQFAKSIIFWNNHTMALGKKSWWKKIFKLK